METHQLDLFAGIAIPTSASRPKSLSMDADALVQWKTRIAAHQQQTKENQPEQGTLFDMAKAHVEPDKIDPFNLRPYPMSFYRLPVDSPGEACIYFVVDNAARLVLYIGETSKSNPSFVTLVRDKSLKQHKQLSALGLAEWERYPCTPSTDVIPV